MSATTPALTIPAARRPLLAPVLAAGLGVVVLFYGLLATSGAAVSFLVAEDGPIESIGTLGLLVGAGGFAFAARYARRESRTPVNRLRVALLVLVAIGLFVAAGEELSWGQRILGLETPDALAERNVQGEINLHNLSGLEGRMDILFQLFWMGGFIALPIAVAASGRLRERLEPLFPIAGLTVAFLLTAVYLGAQISEPLFQASSWESEYPVTHSVTETKEALAGLGLGLAGVLAARRLRPDRTA